MKKHGPNPLRESGRNPLAHAIKPSNLDFVNRLDYYIYQESSPKFEMGFSKGVERDPRVWIYLQQSQS